MKILVCPLNWGLGHATRCIPIIRQLIDEGHETVLVCDGFPLELLRQEFPALRMIELSSYPIHYSEGNSQVGAMLRSSPAIIKGIFREHQWLKELLQKEHFDRVISDNRFGMWNKKIQSTYITHQLMIKMPPGLRMLEPVLWLIHRRVIHHYDVCWIPDRKEKGGLSGDLAHKYPLPRNAEFIGTLSRFDGMEKPNPDDNFEVVAVLSGIEPQRTIFEERLIHKCKNKPFRTLIIRGLPQSDRQEKQIGNITMVSHLSDTGLVAHLLGAEKIICRSGYSSIMDMEALDCLHKTEFVPTPGQTEQEYLYSLYRE